MKKLVIYIALLIIALSMGVGATLYVDNLERGVGQEGHEDHDH